MKYKAHGNGVVLTDCKDFRLDQTLECGQYFQYERLSAEEYSLAAFSKVLHIRRELDDLFFFPTELRDFETIWIPFFDLERDYTAIKNILTAADPTMRTAIEFSPGIRILRQDPWECLISFILSQNNNIVRIKQLTRTISSAFGKSLDEGWFSFPTATALANRSLDDLLRCKTGFRAKYMLDAAQKIADGSLDLSNPSREHLNSIRGVGPKIADCILLFAYGKMEVFPTDVWIKRIMEHVYFAGQKASMTAIQRLAHEKFGAYAGLAQQYLFAYARSNQIGKETRSKIRKEE